VSPLRTLRQIVAPTGRHRSPRTSPAPAPGTVSLDDLLGPATPTRPAGPAVTQRWDDCPPCGKATVGIAHADGWTCGECLTTSPGTPR